MDPSDCLTCFCRVYWPMFVLIFYILSPLPTFISRRLSDDTDSSSNACRELAYFLTTGIVVSAFGLPIVLARTNAVSCLQDDFSKHSCHPWFLSVCAVSTILVASVFVLDRIPRCTLCQLCIEITKRWQWDSSRNKTDSASILFLHRFSGVPAVWWWLEMLSSSSPSLASLSFLEEGTILAGSSGRAPVDCGQREKSWTELNGWMGRWMDSLQTEGHMSY